MNNFFAFLDLIATIFFILGLKGLSSPKSAIQGNFFAMMGMALAIGICFFHPHIQNYTWIITGLVLGAVVGMSLALKIQMTAMPQLVAILHSFVGLSAVGIALGTWIQSTEVQALERLELSVGSMIGAITFTGSLIAFGKLQEILKSQPFLFPAQHWVNLILILTLVGLITYFCLGTPCTLILLLIIILSFILGFALVLPIGGADMPVVVSTLNSYSGWAACATGFSLGQPLLITTGALVGSSGAILSYIMCQAMNRSFISVLLGGVGTLSSVSTETQGKTVRSAASEDVAFMLENASQVIFVPGYGMAVAQAQHAIKELSQILISKGVSVKFAIHPVAGRMPGHMNVLLAEADIPYDIVSEMEEINHEFSTTEVVFVIGANDVVNPAAKTDRTSPLYGMPILDAYKAKQIYINKRSMKSGYSGVDNALFYYPNCSLVFGDAKQVCEKMIQALKG